MKYDFIVVGAGILGLSTAHALKRKRPDANIIILEKEKAQAEHQTGRNSGVIHAGVYYKPGSLKAKLCREGISQTIRFCREHDISFAQCGKLVVSTSELEDDRLAAISKRAAKNGVKLRSVCGSELKELEPNIQGSSAILVEETGIVDYGQICKELVGSLVALGVTIKFGVELKGLFEGPSEIVAVTDNAEIEAVALVSCAGLQSDRVAGMLGLADDFRIIPFRGEYFRLGDNLDNVVNHLIYPVPDPAYPFLGVHLTKTIHGHTTVGPNAVLSLGRESYLNNFPVNADSWSMLSFPGFWKMALGNLRAGLHEFAGSASKMVYLSRCKKYCPSLTLSDLHPMRTGIRAQAVGANGKLIDDFLIKRSRRSVHVCNAPSPAATSAFPIAAAICAELFKKHE
ncbi:L-2-hydroxyglutarate oxidase [Maritalea sp.]|jgi:L-2-hydroxyglutarate oxidase|uniref:L-2-hydroxyglutarate oxidase n=1 Tax=Maritalea sp. TaxID=2003361 RepID=UPI0039E6F837